MNRGYNPITEGLIKAMGFLAQGAPARSKPPKSEVIDAGTIVHAKRWLTPAKRSALDDLMSKIRTETDPEKGAELVRELRTQHEVKGVRIKRRIQHDHSRYQGELLAQVKKFGGPKEQARAVKRRASAQLLAA